jgi:uncharacterized BrkB/YihY/UPF0761 family membrane protein
VVILLKKLFDSGKKILAVWLVFHSTVWIYLSYYLAYTGHEKIAETLSGKVVTEVIAVFAGYAVTATVSNVFRYNNFGGKSTYKEDTKNKNIDC